MRTGRCWSHRNRRPRAHRRPGRHRPTLLRSVLTGSPVVDRHRTRSRAESGAARDRNLLADQSPACLDLSPGAGQGPTVGRRSLHPRSPHRHHAIAETTLLRVATGALAGAGKQYCRGRRSCHQDPAGVARPAGRHGPALLAADRRSHRGVGPAADRRNLRGDPVLRRETRPDEARRSLRGDPVLRRETRPDEARRSHRGVGPDEARRSPHRRWAEARRNWDVLRRHPAGDRRNDCSRSAGHRIAHLPATAGHLLAYRAYRDHRDHRDQPVRPSLVTQARPAHRDAALQTSARRDVAACRLDRAVRSARPLACVDGQARYLSVHLVRPPEWQSGCLMRCGRAGTRPSQ